MYFGTFARFRVKGKQQAMSVVRLPDGLAARGVWLCTSDIGYRNILDTLLDRHDPFRRHAPESLKETAFKVWFQTQPDVPKHPRVYDVLRFAGLVA